ncbi:cytochrome oxidase c subunit VIb-domain-containing protein [Mycena albidolilacea]|uniref:Cytochrome oxidase c subunit VIb-domain-containing protein n=1 Tax=Mycena albidolilacea TaxID=1033008 RepID=A0AAD7EF71_9AGAR|nr:cytochrome oxidase c subunit VIb-domain-containing protein [Mycena albidolilacea]
MGWWPFGDSSSADPSLPTRQERQKCWESRDAYFACLDGVGVVNAGTEGKVCAAENRVYEKSCAQSWVTYFNERRKLAFRQKDMIAQANAQNATAKR